MKLRLNSPAHAFLVGLLGVLGMDGQSYQGNVRGLITDKQQAVVANAQIVLTNETTGISRATVSNSDGQYVFSAVEPAGYRIAVSAPGFARVERKSVTIGAQQFLTLDFQLELSSVNEQIEVTAAPPLVNVSTASNGQVIDTRQLQNLPPVARNPYLFEKLENNVAATAAINGNSKFDDQNGISQVSVAGGPPASNNYMVDGVPITDLNNRSVIIPSPDAIAEINLQANTYDAEAGRTGGGTFNTVLKSGTNSLHGTLYGQTRHTNWAAHPFFFAAGSPYNVDYYNYAGSIGGPVLIPRVYNGKNKTFFQITEEGFRQRNATTATYYVPTALERSGDFSASSVSVFNPFAGLSPCPSPLPATQMCRQPFPGNRIPANLINPVGLAIAAFMPLPNKPVGKYGQPDFARSVSIEDHVDEFIGKLDHQFSSRWYANFSYMHYASHNPTSNPLDVYPGAPTDHVLFRRVDAIAQNNTFTLSPTTVLTFGYGFNRFPNNNIDLSNGYSQIALGLPPSYVNALQKASFPAVSMQTSASVGASNPGYSVFYSRSFVAALAKTIGRHSLKMGYDFRTLSVDFTDTTYGNGTFAFANTFSEQLPNAGNVNTGADVADLLLGTPTSGSVTATTLLRLNVHYQGVFLQDNFRVTSRFTLNFGLRYEHEPGIRERDNHFAVGFDSGAMNPLSATAGIPTRGGIEFADVNGYPAQCCNASDTMFSPRVGLALALSSRTVLRAGFGIFYAPTFYTANSSVAPGYTQTNVYVASNDGNLTPANSLSNPFPAGIQQPTGNTLGYLTGIGNQLTVIDRGRRSPLVEQYSLDLQRELPWRMALKIGYVGAKGRDLQTTSTGTGTATNVGTGGANPGAANIDQLPGIYLPLGAQLLAKVANPYYNHGGAGVIGSATVAYNQLLRPFPEFSSVNELLSSGKSLYNALNLKLQKQVSQGISLLATYTWSSNWDSTWGTANGLNPGPALPQDAGNLNGEYSRGLDDIPQRFSLGTIVELPFGHGKPLSARNRALDYVAGGWSLDAVAYIQTGAPLAVYQNTNNNAVIGAGTQRPNLIGNACLSGSPESRLNNYLNAPAFSTAPIFTYGNTPRTIPCYGPGLNGWDLALYKDVRVERVTLRFQAEALNAFNTPQFGAPVTKFGAVTFGQIQTQANYPRFLQLGARISF
jgi:hypothetical protein